MPRWYGQRAAAQAVHVFLERLMSALETKLEDRLEEVIKNLVRDVAAGVHAMYRGDIRQQTAQVRMSAFVTQAREALLPLLGGSGGVSAMNPMSVGSLHPPARTSAALSAEEAAAITRCIMAWGPMGNPSEAAPDSRCAPGAKELVPSWGDREKAREALRRLAPA
jgi:hypothetical protein